MRVEVLEDAEQDLVDGARFYEAREPGLGQHYLDSLFLSTRCNFALASTQSTLVTIGFCQNVSPTRSTTGFTETWPRFGQSSTAAKSRRRLRCG